MTGRLTGTAVIMMALTALTAGCGGGGDAGSARESFDAIVDDAVAVYTSLHPLRASRLGLPGADSLLFTFSPEETEAALSAIDTMLEALSALPADELDERRIDEAVLLGDWMKGERFVFRHSRTCLDNPLLYCWMAEEAILSIPARPWPAHEGEFEAWSSRLTRLPVLLGNAEGLLKKPGGVHLEEAALRLDALLDMAPRIDGLARRRHGKPAPALDGAFEAVRGYRTALEPYLGARTTSRQIMGLEELSTILQYSEHLDFDHAKMTIEAEKIMRRLARQIVPSDVAVKVPGAAELEATAGLADSILGEAEMGIESRKTFRNLKGHRSPVMEYGKVWEPFDIAVNPYLTLPVSRLADIRPVFAGEGSQHCLPSVMIPAGATYSSGRLVFDLLMSTSLMSAPEVRMCSAGSPVRRIFGSSTHGMAWRAHNANDLTGLFPERRMELSRIMTRERVSALARLILVFRLHSGKFTAEAAAEHLRALVSLDDGWVGEQVRLASISPVSAFDGIAFMTVESMVKKATADRSGGKPRDKVRKLLLETAGMPPYLIMLRMSD
jgi:hypothetical protein